MASPKKYVLFEEYPDIEKLAVLTGYTEGHLLNIKRGYIKPGLKFKAVCQMKLERPVGELFRLAGE